MDNNESQEARFVRIEERMDRQRTEINSIRDRQDEQHLDMKGIAQRLDTLNHTISRGQWIILGAIGLFVLQSMGLSEFLKKILI
jgi:hypothetical protein